MTIRRRALVLIAAALTLGIGAMLALGALWVLKTESGLDLVRVRVERLLAGKVHGKVYFGRLGGSLLSAPTIDSLEIRDADDSVLVATGRISLRFDLIDLWDKRIVLRNVEVEHPFVHLRHGADGSWNYKKVFASRGEPALPSVGRTLGDEIVIDSVTLHDGHFSWTDPWSPSDWLRGAQRDSAIKTNLERTDTDVKRGADGLVKTRHWRGIEAVVPHARIRHPDTAGVAVAFTRLDADENDPPFTIRSARGTVLVVHDTVRIAIESFRFPGSAGSAKGELLTKRGLGVRVRVVGDTVSLADIAWLYPTFPTEGGGRMILDIRKDSTNGHVDYALSKMDVRSTRSRLTGAMTFGVGEELLALTAVDVDLAPVDFKLIERFSGGPLSLPWAGQLLGHVRGPGGPLNRFVVDSATIDFVDANVPGVVNRFRGHGELDIVRPVAARFHDFALDVQHFDLRTAQALNKTFPPWKGWVFGTARLDSIWSDVRFRDGDIRHAADSASVSRFTGYGRVTVADVAMIYDLALIADSLKLDAVALTYPAFGLRGTVAGPFTMKGTMGDLYVTGDLAGAGGRARTTDMHVDALEPRYAVNGHLDLMNIDPARMLVGASRWKGSVTAAIDAAVSGDSVATLQGGLRVGLDRSSLAGIKLQKGHARFTMGDGLLRVDSLAVFSDALALQGKGALGLRAGRVDSLRLTAQLDSLGGLRPFLAPLADSLPVDSLLGNITATARLVGNVDSLDMRLALRGTDLAYGATIAKTLNIDADIASLTRAYAGDIALTTTGMTLAGIHFASMRAAAAIAQGARARVVSHLVSATGPVIDGGADVFWDSVSTRAMLDSLQVLVGDHRWRLARPASFVLANGMLTVDSFEVRTGEKAVFALSAMFPETGDVSGSLRAEALPLVDVGRLLQVPIPLSGAATLGVTLAGTRDAPQLTFALHAQDATLGETRVEGLSATGAYRDRSLQTKLEYSRKGAAVLRGAATLPMDLALRPRSRRLLDAPLSGSLDADTTDLAVIEAFSSAITKATGVLDVHLQLNGTWDEPRVAGRLRIVRGAMSFATLGTARYDNIRAQISLMGDSLQIDTLSAHSGSDAGAVAQVFGGINFADLSDPSFSLRLRTNRFRAISNRDVAELDLTTIGTEGLRLVGRQSGSVLTGGLTINGIIHVPDSYRRNVIVLADSDYVSSIDTALFANRQLLPTTPPAIVQNLRVQDVSVLAGDNLRLQSQEADIKLTGGLDVQVGTSTRASDRRRRQLTLSGVLSSQGGTYRLNYGPIQRTFVVEPGGTVQFFNDPDVNPEIHINALYTVRQYDQRDARQDIRVRAELGGSLSQLTVRLSSPDSLRISGADLVSYLLTGSPSVEIGGRASDYGTMVTRGLITSAGSFLGSRLGGGRVDVNLSTAGVASGYYGGLRTAGSNILQGTRINVAWQLTDRWLVRPDVGLCQFGQVLGGAQFDAVGFANSVGVKLEGSFSSGLGLSIGFDPPTSALLCAQGATARGFVPTPRQFGGDLFRRWRF